MIHPFPGRTCGFGFGLEQPWESREWHEQIRQSLERVATLRTQVVAMAEREYGEWHNPDLTETMPAGRTLVSKYWRGGVRRTVSDGDLASTTWQDANPWSAAFISYVMREAGAGSEFPYASAHAAYIRAAIDNRLNQVRSIFQGFRLVERALELGDIIARSREHSGATYDTVRRGMLTHCDIVTELEPASGVVRAIGGNVHQNVDRKTLSMDTDGHLTTPGYFAVIKMDPVIPSLRASPCPVHSVDACDDTFSRSWRTPGIVNCLPGEGAFDPAGFGRCTCDPEIPW
ncbi:MAG TPA: DUF2272 domain-containing protein [Verrucomicrobiae bacterium]|jgi:hypothetical protein|nr:DUF2272 domain-containing protein [Verrucomicrobiae bacterium]